MIAGANCNNIDDYGKFILSEYAVIEFDTKIKRIRLETIFHLQFWILRVNMKSQKSYQISIH